MRRLFLFGAVLAAALSHLRLLLADEASTTRVSSYEQLRAAFTNPASRRIVITEHLDLRAVPAALNFTAFCDSQECTDVIDAPYGTSVVQSDGTKALFGDCSAATAPPEDWPRPSEPLEPGRCIVVLQDHNLISIDYDAWIGRLDEAYVFIQGLHIVVRRNAASLGNGAGASGQRIIDAENIYLLDSVLEGDGTPSCTAMWPTRAYVRGVTISGMTYFQHSEPSMRGASALQLTSNSSVSLIDTTIKNCTGSGGEGYIAPITLAFGDDSDDTPTTNRLFLQGVTLANAALGTSVYDVVTLGQPIFGGEPSGAAATSSSSSVCEGDATCVALANRTREWILDTSHTQSGYVLPFVVQQLSSDSAAGLPPGFKFPSETDATFRALRDGLITRVGVDPNVKAPISSDVDSPSVESASLSHAQHSFALLVVMATVVALLV